ncbi:hypothetical protein [Nocardia sp. IFM 10818]
MSPAAYQDRPAPRPPARFGCVVSVPLPDVGSEWIRYCRNLSDILLGLVPLSIEETSRWPADRVDRERRAAVAVIATHGDDLLFDGPDRGACLNALARAFALGARAEGGMTAFGIHACLNPHIGCPGHNAVPDPDAAAP